MAKKTQDKPDHASDELLKQLQDMEANWKRALADYQNLEKRTRESQQMMAQLASLTLVEKLLPILDHLSMAAKHINDPGLTMIIKQFEDVLASEGVSRIEAEDKPFDPLTMECVEQVEGTPDRVLEVVNQGYTIGTRVIRPAKVKVGIKKQ